MSSQPKLYLRGGTWWVDLGHIGGVRLRKSTKQSDEASARLAAIAMQREVDQHRRERHLRALVEPQVSASWAENVLSADAEQVLARIWKNSKSRAAQAGLLWALSWDDFLALVHRSDGKCMVTGLPFTMTVEPKHPFKPSIDRLDNSTGYSVGNCRLVLMCVNYAMNVWGEDLFRLVALSYAAEVMKSAARLRHSENHNVGSGAKLLI